MPDITTDFEAGTPGAAATPALLDASTTGGGTWSINGAAGNATFASGRVGTGLSVLADTTFTYARLTLPSPVADLSYSAWFRTFDTTHQYNSIDAVRGLRSGDYMVLGWYPDQTPAGTGRAVIHTAAGDSTAIRLPFGQWFQFHFRTIGSTAEMVVNDEAGAQVGATVSMPIGGGNFTEINLGRGDGHSGGHSGPILTDGLAVDTTAAEFPVNPPTDTMDITMQWNSNPDSPDGYRIKREGPPGTWAQVGADTAATSATVTGASSGENYAVAAYNQYGEGPLSTPVQVGAPPAQVTGLQITSVS